MGKDLSIVQAADQKFTGSVCIRPFFTKEVANMGLEKYGLSLFDGTFHEEPIALIEKNGAKYYVTGLNEFAPEIKMIKDPDEKAAKIKEIRTIVAQLEKEMNMNVLDIEDPKFWDSVTTLKPNNDAFWSQLTIRCGNEPVYLTPETDGIDLIKVRAIEAGGFSMIAKSYSEARSMAKPPKFYLDKNVETLSIKTELAKTKNKALAELQKLYDKNINKLMYVAKVVDANSAQYKKTTPNDIIYDNMDRFINGEGVEKSVKRAAEEFLKAAGLDMETLKIRAMIKDATFYKIIVLKSDGFIYHLKSATMMGRNTVDCIEFLKNPLNDKVLAAVTEEVESYWIS
jgi:hypothetical protein